MLPRTLSHVVGWAQTHHFYSVDFEEREMSIWTFDKNTFRHVAAVNKDGFSINATHDLSVQGSVVAAVSGSASFVAISGGPMC